MPQISVIMSVYKEPVEWMRQAIDSILNQTYTDFEFIIVNDKPDREENTFLLNEYAQKDVRVKIITNEQNIGLTKSLNKGLEVAKGEYIARMDADDISLPNRFRKQIEILESSQADLCHCNISFIDKDGNKLNHKVRTLSKFDYDDLFAYSVIVHPTVMFKRALIQLRDPLYNEKCKRSQDYELWTFLYLNESKFEYLHEKFLNYRISPSQITSQNNVEQVAIYKNIRANFINSYLSLNNINIGGKTDLEIIDILKGECRKKGRMRIAPLRKIQYLYYYRMIFHNPKLFISYLMDCKTCYTNGYVKLFYMATRMLGVKTIDYLL